VKLISYVRPDETESVGILRDDLGGAIDLVRALAIYSVAADECMPMVTDMLDLIAYGLADPLMLKEVQDFLEKHNLTEELLDTDYKVMPLSLGRARSMHWVATTRRTPGRADWSRRRSRWCSVRP
jgi:hypothetical protein